MHEFWLSFFRPLHLFCIFINVLPSEEMISRMRRATIRLGNDKDKAKEKHWQIVLSESGYNNLHLTQRTLQMVHLGNERFNNLLIVVFSIIYSSNASISNTITNTNTSKNSNNKLHQLNVNALQLILV